MRLLLALLLLLVPGIAAAQPPATVVSAAPDRVSVTVYRDPDRGRTDPMNLSYLRGFALVTETRTIRLPQGPAVIRFEGVAEGIIPVSAIVDGLPGGTVEKNRDARLLSPASLVDGSLGRIVTLTTTDRATGEVRQEQATIVAGPSPGVVVRTATGIEALRCSGLPETLRFPTMPDGLSAKPVLSVSTVTPRDRTVTVTLSYLASGFDWSASYVATLAPDGKDLNLFAWLTLANNNPERFADADVQVVAGRLNHARMQAVEQRVSALRLNCYPLGTTTSDLPSFGRPEPGTLMLMDGNRMSRDIVVTGTSLRGVAPAAMSAPAPPPPPEDLGDLKLYRVPERVTVAPRGQKQVALLAREQVKFERRYRLSIYPGQTIEAASTQIVLKLNNVKEDGLGLALPAGTPALYADRQGEKLLLGTDTLTDYAEGQTLRIGAGISSQVRIEQTATTRNQSTLTVSNANPFAVLVELPIGGAGQKIEAANGALARVEGIMTWIVTVAPNDSAELAYRY